MAFHLVSGSGLARHTVTHDLRAGRGSAGSGGRLQHRAYRAGGFRRDHLAPGRDACIPDKGYRHQFAVAREDRVALRQLKQ